MRRFLCHKLIAVTILASTSIPQSALSMSLWDSGDWKAHSFYARTRKSALSSGIGGEEVEERSIQTEIVFKTSALSTCDEYRGGNAEDEQLTFSNFLNALSRIFWHTSKC
jgi:hypothetical protein